MGKRVLIYFKEKALEHPKSIILWEKHNRA